MSHLDSRGHTPDKEGRRTAARGRLEVLPRAGTVVGGLLLPFSGNRATAMLGASSSPCLGRR